MPEKDRRTLTRLIVGVPYHGGLTREQNKSLTDALAAEGKKRHYVQAVIPAVLLWRVRLYAAAQRITLGEAVEEILHAGIVAAGNIYVQEGDYEIAVIPTRWRGEHKPSPDAKRWEKQRTELRRERLIKETTGQGEAIKRAWAKLTPEQRSERTKVWQAAGVAARARKAKERRELKEESRKENP